MTSNEHSGAKGDSVGSVTGPGASLKPRDWFATTHWSVVLGAQDQTSPRADEALQALCQTYWFPVYSHIRHRGSSAEDAQDLTQEFFARLIEKDFLAVVQQERGKFRSFLRCCINRFLAKEWRKAGAQKRGGQMRAISIDEQSAEAQFRTELQSHESPDKIFDRQWALTLLERARSRLETEYARSDNKIQFRRLSRFLIAADANDTYAQAAEVLGLNKGAVTKAVRRMRKRYAHLIRVEIAQTIANPADIEEELRHLRAALRGAPP